MTATTAGHRLNFRVTAIDGILFQLRKSCRHLPSKGNDGRLTADKPYFQSLLLHAYRKDFKKGLHLPSFAVTQLTAES
jgi:hypothetical protein